MAVAFVTGVRRCRSAQRSSNDFLQADDHQSPSLTATCPPRRAADLLVHPPGTAVRGSWPTAGTTFTRMRACGLEDGPPTSLTSSGKCELQKNAGGRYPLSRGGAIWPWQDRGLRLLPFIGLDASLR
jgi:hypothetical protein